MITKGRETQDDSVNFDWVLRISNQVLIGCKTIPGQKARIITQGVRTQLWTLIRRLYKFRLGSHSQWQVKSARRLAFVRYVETATVI